MPWWRITKKTADLDRELQSDLELEEEEQRERGLSSKDARYAAMRAFGNTTLIREQTQATWSWNWLESFAGDLKYGLPRNASQCGFHHICDSHRRPRYRRCFDSIQRRQCAPVTSAALPRSGSVGIHFQWRKLQHPNRTLCRPARPESVLLRSSRAGPEPTARATGN